MASEPKIADLEALAAALPARLKNKFEHIYAVETLTGETQVCPEMQSWVKKQFGSVEAITEQKVVRLTNKVTGEESFFNELRSLRPTQVKNQTTLEDELEKARREDIFQNPLSSTTEDIIGRVKGKYCITASNIAKSDAVHGVIIFNDFNPLTFSREKVADYIDTAREWAVQMQRVKPEAKYFLYFWNCLWRAGATQAHGHNQVMLATGKHYVKIEKLRKSALEYREKYNADYFQDLYEVHLALGCALDIGGTHILSYLTPLKYAEVVLLADTLDTRFKSAVYEMLAFFRDTLGSTAFNFGLATPPLASTPESWEGFPCIGRIIDRGSFEDRTSDFGGFELFGATMALSDPFHLARVIQDHLAEGKE